MRRHWPRIAVLSCILLASPAVQAQDAAPAGEAEPPRLEVETGEPFAVTGPPGEVLRVRVPGYCTTFRRDWPPTGARLTTELDTDPRIQRITAIGRLLEQGRPGRGTFLERSPQLACLLQEGAFATWLSEHTAAASLVRSAPGLAGRSDAAWRLASVVLSRAAVRETVQYALWGATSEENLASVLDYYLGEITDPWDRVALRLEAHLLAPYVQLLLDEAECDDVWSESTAPDVVGEGLRFVPTMARALLATRDVEDLWRDAVRVAAAGHARPAQVHLEAAAEVTADVELSRLLLEQAMALQGGSTQLGTAEVEERLASAAHLALETPAWPAGEGALGEAWLRLHASLEGSEDRLQQAVCRHRLAQIAWHQERVEDARVHFTQVVALTDQLSASELAVCGLLRKRAEAQAAVLRCEAEPRFVQCCEQADACLAAGNRQDAVTHLRQALEVLPGSTGPRHQLALLLLELGQVDEAADQWRAILERDPQDAEAWAGLAEVYAQQGDEPRTAEARANARELQ